MRFVTKPNANSLFARGLSTPDWTTKVSQSRFCWFATVKPANRGATGGNHAARRKVGECALFIGALSTPVTRGYVASFRKRMTTSTRAAERFQLLICVIVNTAAGKIAAFALHRQADLDGS